MMFTKKKIIITKSLFYDFLFFSDATLRNCRGYMQIITKKKESHEKLNYCRILWFICDEDPYSDVRLFVIIA